MCVCESASLSLSPQESEDTYSLPSLSTHTPTHHLLLHLLPHSSSSGASVKQKLGQWWEAVYPHVNNSMYQLPSYKQSYVSAIGWTSFVIRSLYQQQLYVHLNNSLNVSDPHLVNVNFVYQLPSYKQSYVSATLF